MPFARGLDVIQQAQSGTGKTATFCAGVLNNLDFNLPECQALVLAPTRELAQQIEKVMRALGDYLQVRRRRRNDGHPAAASAAQQQQHSIGGPIDQAQARRRGPCSSQLGQWDCMGASLACLGGSCRRLF